MLLVPRNVVYNKPGTIQGEEAKAACSLFRTLTFTYSHFYSYSHSLTLTHSHSRSLTHSHSLLLTLTNCTSPNPISGSLLPTFRNCTRPNPNSGKKLPGLLFVAFFFFLDVEGIYRPPQDCLNGDPGGGPKYNRRPAHYEVRYLNWTLYLNEKRIWKTK